VVEIARAGFNLRGNDLACRHIIANNFYEGVNAIIPFLRPEYPTKLIVDDAADSVDAKAFGMV
jgi:hypothetical protein